MDILHRFALGVRLQINIPEVLVQFCQRQLDGSLHRIDVNGRDALPDNLSCRAKLIPEHEFYQFDEYAVLGTENVLEGADRHIGIPYNFCHRSAVVTLFQEQADAGGQNSFLCGEACACNRHTNYSFHFKLVYIPYIAYN